MALTGGGSAVVDPLLSVTPIEGFRGCSLFCCALLCVRSSFAIILMGKERAGCFALFVFLMSRDCCVALPHSATGLSTVVIVVFPYYTHYFGVFVLFCSTLCPFWFCNHLVVLLLLCSECQVAVIVL